MVFAISEEFLFKTACFQKNFSNELVRHRCAMFLRDVVRLKSPLYNENRQYWRDFLLRDVKKCYEKYIFVERLKERTK